MDNGSVFHQPSELQLHSTTESLSAVIDEKSAYLFRQWLKSKNFEDIRKTSRKIAPSSVAIPVNDDFVSRVVRETFADGSYAFDGFCFQLQNIDLPLKSSKRRENTVDRLVKDLSCLEHPRFSWSKALERDLPHSWERHGDLVLLPEQCFLRKEWEDLGDDLWKLVASAFHCSRIAKRGRITNNSFRSPAVSLLLGSNGLVEHVDNKIRYRYDATKCMFSAGNITEKLRIARFNCKGETIVDLFADLIFQYLREEGFMVMVTGQPSGTKSAQTRDCFPLPLPKVHSTFQSADGDGIGYFTLPYLVHAGASLVYACEWNPAAVEALKTNLALNGVADKCIVLEGDNRQSCPKGVADRVNLGLIPSCEGSLDTACAALRPESGGILHVHGNVTSRSVATTQTSAPTTKPNTNLQTSMFHANSHASITSGIKSQDEEIVETSCYAAVSDIVEGKTPVIADGRNCDTSHDTNNSQEINMCHPKSDKNTTLPVLQVHRTSFEIPPNKLDSKTTTETNIKSVHHIGGAVAYPAVNHRLPANERCSADGQNEGHDSGKVGEGKHVKSGKREWVDWASEVCQKLEEIFHLQTSKQWQINVIHIEHVKSYAPHVDHIVADIRCSPGD